jgi:hypothetical protein
MGLMKGEANVVQLLAFDDGCQPGAADVTPRLYMEYIQGDTLHNLLAAWSEVRDWFPSYLLAINIIFVCVASSRCKARV